METFDAICPCCSEPYNGLRGQCETCTDIADAEEWETERELGL